MRIKVIHKQNEGVSYARKTGVENATAEYVTFVDADDWIDSNMYADMMTALLSTHSDIAQCDFCIVFEDGRMEHRVRVRNTDHKILGRTESVIMVAKDHRWRVSFFTKIFRKKLFDNVVFPRGRVYGEDMIVYHLFHQAAQTVFLDREYYFYFVRSDSISSDGDMKKEMKKYSDFSDAQHELYLFVKQHPEYHSILNLAEHGAILYNVGVLWNMIVFPQYFTNDYFYAKAKQLRAIPFAKGRKFSRGVRLELLVIKISPLLYKISKTLYVKIVHFTNGIKLTNRTTSYILSDHSYKKEIN